MAGAAHHFPSFAARPLRGFATPVSTTRQYPLLGHGQPLLFEAEFCNPASGWEKGQVEKNVQDARHGSGNPCRAFRHWMPERLAGAAMPGAVGQTPHGSDPAPSPMSGRRKRRPDAGAAALRWLRRIHQARFPTCLVHLERNRYSVPASFANRPVSLRVYPEQIVVVAEGQIICEHRRIIDRSHDRQGQTVYDWRHYLAVIQRKPGALRNGAPFTELPDAFRRCSSICSGSPAATGRWSRSWRLSCSMTSRPCCAAVEMALEAGVPTKTHVLNLLHRLIDGKPPRTGRGCSSGSDADQRTAGRCRALRCAAPGQGGAPCVMIPPAARSSSCCAA